MAVWLDCEVVSVKVVVSMAGLGSEWLWDCGSNSEYGCECSGVVWLQFGCSAGLWKAVVCISE